MMALAIAAGIVLGVVGLLGLAALVVIVSEVLVFVWELIQARGE